jgi:hypothetical protein
MATISDGNVSASESGSYSFARSREERRNKTTNPPTTRPIKIAGSKPRTRDVAGLALAGRAARRDMKFP